MLIPFIFVSFTIFLLLSVLLFVSETISNAFSNCLKIKMSTRFLHCLLNMQIFNGRFPWANIPLKWALSLKDLIPIFVLTTKYKICLGHITSSDKTEKLEFDRQIFWKRKLINLFLVFRCTDFLKTLPGSRLDEKEER